MIFKTAYGFLAVLLLSSCSAKGSFQGLFSYYKVSKSKNPGLFIRQKVDASLCQIETFDSPKVVMINGDKLKECVQKNNKSMIYMWSPRCKSKVCYPLEKIQQLCNQKNIELYIVAEYYDIEFMNCMYNIKKPVFAIDTKYYRTNFTAKYMAAFIFDLTSQKDISNRFIFFNNGKFDNSFQSLTDVP